eukprot:TRINITY_DN5056_c1_g1_i1.p1 TRINITY_DN5056_c1_g1~~TRINITY_DN5056_c1_g1_i1.p1  ORF type:complete len:270 (+),score=69.47 TRINITY_DN5056_c1_g1_i1:65-874(+)
MLQLRFGLQETEQYFLKTKRRKRDTHKKKKMDDSRKRGREDDYPHAARRQGMKGGGKKGGKGTKAGKTGKRLEEVDRQKVCPFLVKVFIKVGEFEDPSGFTMQGGVPEGAQEVRLYCWKDTTLKEITYMLGKMRKETSHPQATLHFATLQPLLTTSSYRVCEIGHTRPRHAVRQFDDIPFCYIQPKGDHLLVKLVVNVKQTPAETQQKETDKEPQQQQHHQEEEDDEAARKEDSKSEENNEENAPNTDEGKKEEENDNDAQMDEKKEDE